MKLVLLLPQEQQRYLAHLPPGIKRKIRAALDEIRERPASGKELGEELSGMRSLAVGRFRIIYRVSSPTLRIITIGPRRVVYQLAAIEINRSKSV
jgi:mRNA-degrading endonuclease RelE of RelBE toxin-antitoxin system